MKRIMAVSVLALGLAGCNATVYDNGYHRRPIASVYVPPAPVYVAPRHHVYNPYVYRPAPPRCYTVWERTHYGMRERRVCH
jgi:hypothetical protein